MMPFFPIIKTMETRTSDLSTLHGKKVIVLGASSGIGLATAKAAAKEGSQVVIVSGNQKRINKALKELPASSEGYAVDLNHLPCSVSDCKINQNNNF
jgi:NAD(P)-dependent dehydrogenase (short-subunit alcohol dehydrogenase family)